MQDGERKNSQKKIHEGYLVIVALVLALINGLAFVFVVPPWQHYDEPAQFEYAWLVANTKALPQPGDQDLGMRRSVVESMIEHGFFVGAEASIPDLDNLPKQIYGLWPSQLGESPLYYLLAAVPVMVFGNADVTTQLYMIRLLSLLLYLCTVGVSWGIAREVFPRVRALHWLLPLALALTPAFTDLMTAANNDVLAVLFFSLFLWGCLRLIIRGFSWPTGIWVLVAAGLCVLTKSTVFIALPLAGAAILFALLRKINSWIVFGAVVVLGLLTLPLVFTWEDAAVWYRNTSQELPTRVQRFEAPLGDYALQLDNRAPVTPRWLKPLNQPILIPDLQEFRGKKVTFGGWMWRKGLAAPGEVLSVQTPMVNLSDRSFSRQIEIRETPTFFAFTFKVPPRASRLWLTIAPGKNVPDIVYYDGLFLVEGVFSSETQPVFTDVNGVAGNWDGVPFENLVRNGSAENTWPSVRNSFDSLGARFLPDQTRPSMLVYAILDWKGSGWYFRIAGARLFRTFWAKFGWAHVPLAGNKPYRPLLLISLVGLLGWIIYPWRRKFALPRHVILFLGLTLLSVLGIALMRGVILMFLKPLIPTARYAYPTIIPMISVFILGWVLIFDWLETKFKLPDWVKGIVFGLFFVWLDIYAIYSIVLYYSG